MDTSGNLYGTTSLGGTSNDGTVFELTTAPPSKLTIISSPTSVTAGSVIGAATGIQVGVDYPHGNVDTNDFSTVTLTLQGGTFAGGGTAVTAQAVDGIATFNNLAISGAGGYTLSATDGSLTSASAELSVRPAPLITGVEGNVVAVDWYEPPPFTIYGNNFQVGSTITFRDLTTGEISANYPFTSLTSSQIAVVQVFSAADQCSVEVIDPDGTSSGQFDFSVASALSTPAITSMSQNPVPGSDSRQPMTLNGSGFQSGMVVELLDTSDGGGPYYEPAAVTSDGSATFSADFTNATASWTAQAVNPDGGTSATYSFQVGAVSPPPTISQVTAQPASAGNNWTFTIQGTNLGSLASYVGGDNAYLNLIDSTQGFSAGNTGDPITASVVSWTKNAIQISALAGAYGQVLSVVEPGDTLSVVIDNPQTGLNSSAFAFVAAQAASPVTGGPTVHVPSTVTAAENSTVIFSAASGDAITVFDPQAEGPYEQLAIAASGGTFALATTANLAVAAGASSTSEIVTGTLAAMNADLAGLVYTPAAGTTGDNYSLAFTLTNLAAANQSNQLAGSATVGIIVSAAPPQSGTPTQTDTEVDVTATIDKDGASLTLTEGTHTISSDDINASYIDDILQATQEAAQIEQVLDAVPGWHLDVSVAKAPTYSLSITGSLFFTPAGSIDTGSKLSISVSADVGAQVEGYFGVKLPDSSVGLDVGGGVTFDLGAEVGMTASYDNGAWDFTGDGDVQGTIGAFLEGTAYPFSGEASLDGTATGDLTTLPTGVDTVGLTLSGSVIVNADLFGASIYKQSYPLGSVSTPSWSFNLGQIADNLVIWASNDFLAASSTSISRPLAQGTIYPSSTTSGTDAAAAPAAMDQSNDAVPQLEEGVGPGYSLGSLAAFSGTNGSNPISGLIADSTGDLFGTTTSGGANGDGTVFEIAKGSTTITTLASFNGFNGANPVAGLVIDSTGDLFGTTAAGGINGDGAVFEVVKGSAKITTLASFDVFNGEAPQAALYMDSIGNLLGTTSTGGAFGYGTAFEVAKGATSIATLASFDWTTGTFPDSSLIADASGNLYGTTSIGGAAGDGTVFEIVKGSGKIITLASFDGEDGANPECGLAIDSTGNLYGTTEGGGDANGDGTVFEIAAGSGTIDTLARFAGGDGANPFGGVIMDSSGDLFGTTSTGGNGGYGTVFEIVKGSGAVSVLALFDLTHGSAPLAGLTADSSGNLFGTAEFGGGGTGTVFELSPLSTATPVITPPSGIYAGSVNVTIADAAVGAVIHYTLDGSMPTITSPTYSVALKVSVSETVTAVAFKTGMTASAAASATYAIAPSITGVSVDTTILADTATVAPMSAVVIGDVMTTVLDTATITLATPMDGTLADPATLTTGKFAAGITPGTYALTATPANLSTAIKALIFTPVKNLVNPGVTYTENFTIAVNDGTLITTNAVTAVTIKSINDAPTITGTRAAGTTTTTQNANDISDHATTTPFANAVILDPDVTNTSPVAPGTGAPQTLTVTILPSAANGTLAGIGLSGAGTTASPYTLAGTAAQVSAEIDALVFTPKEHQVAVGLTETTTFTIKVSDGVVTTPTSNATTTVIAKAANDAPTGLNATLASSTLKATIPTGNTVAVVANATAVVTLLCIDPNPGDTFTYSLVSGAGSTNNADFIVGTSTNANKLLVNVTGGLGVGIYDVLVQVTDKGGLSYIQAIVITIGTGGCGVALA